MLLLDFVDCRRYGVFFFFLVQPSPRTVRVFLRIQFNIILNLTLLVKIFGMYFCFLLSYRGFKVLYFNQPLGMELDIFRAQKASFSKYSRIDKCKICQTLKILRCYGLFETTHYTNFFSIITFLIVTC